MPHPSYLYRISPRAIRIGSRAGGAPLRPLRKTHRPAGHAGEEEARRAETIRA